MSATRDKNQKIGFVYSNLYHLYKKGSDAAQAASEAPASTPVGLTRGRVIKAEDAAAATAVKVSSFEPAQFLGKRIEAATAAQNAQMAVLARKTPLMKPKPEFLRQTPQSAAVASLKENLTKLNDLHSRLKFMLQELEELVKE